MHFDMSETTPNSIYNLIIGLVVPRPIALVTTQNLQGQLNCAPFSSYNYLSTDPPVIGLGVASRAGPGIHPKDTAQNILDTKEFVVNVVTEEIMQKMNVCAIDFPPEVNELEEAGFETEPSVKISVPRIRGIHAALECRHLTTMQVGRSHIVLGEVLSMFVADQFVDLKGPYILAEEMHNVGRANGLGSYVRTRDSFFKMPRIKHADWVKDKSSK